MRWLLALSLTACLVPAAHAQGDTEDLINYAFSVGDTAFSNVTGQSVQAVRLPIGYTLRSLDEHPIGVKLVFPVSFGLNELSATDAFGGEIRESLATLSALAGVEVQVPLGTRWVLEPFAELGGGKDLEGGKWATIYSAGLRSVGSFQARRQLYRLGAALDFDGATLADGGPSDAITTLELGLDVRFPIDRGGRWSDWSVYGIRRRFLDPVVFDQLDGSTVELRNQNELGVTFALDPPIDLWLFELERFGAGYRFGERLDSVRILFSVPF